jgi:dipeptidase E
MLLMSGRLQNEAVRGALLDLIGKPFGESRIVVVIDAILPFPGSKAVLLKHLAEYQALGWAEFDVLSLHAGPRSLVESRLRSADVVFGYGGSNHWLAHSWRVTGLAPVLRELLDEKVYLGVSAGSMIFSTRHAAAVDAFDDHDEVRMLGLDSVGPALPLFDWYLAPHLDADYFPHQTQEWAAAAATRLGGQVWFIDDDTALLVRDPAAEPEAVSTGRWLHFEGGQLLGESERRPVAGAGVLGE